MNYTVIKPTSSYCFNYKLFNPINNPYKKAVSFISFSIFMPKKPPKTPTYVSCNSCDNNNNPINHMLSCHNCDNNNHPINPVVSCHNCDNNNNQPINPILSCRNGDNNNNHSINPIVNNNNSVPFSVLAPILQTIKFITSKSKWVFSYLQDPSIKTFKVLHNGGLGMALLTVQMTARDRFSPFVAALAANPTFVSGLMAWFVAQSMKVVLNFVLERRWDMRLMCASGGMPSSHTALCTALTTSVGICHGVADALFPVCLGFSLIVMYDAIGVRRHAGMQAQVLNKIIEDLFQGHPISERKLKELLGHTPSQVFAGAFLGIAVACYCCQACLIPF